MENFGQKNDNALQLLFGLYDCLFRYCQRVGVVVWLLTFRSYPKVAIS